MINFLMFFDLVFDRFWTKKGPNPDPPGKGRGKEKRENLGDFPIFPNFWVFGPL
jgi:hypothetical protein